MWLNFVNLWVLNRLCYKLTIGWLCSVEVNGFHLWTRTFFCVFCGLYLHTFCNLMHSIVLINFLFGALILVVIIEKYC